MHLGMTNYCAVEACHYCIKADETGRKLDRSALCGPVKQWTFLVL